MVPEDHSDRFESHDDPAVMHCREVHGREEEVGEDDHGPDRGEDQEGGFRPAGKDVDAVG